MSCTSKAVHKGLAQPHEKLAANLHRQKLRNCEQINLFAYAIAKGCRAFKTTPEKKWRQNLDGTAPEMLSAPAIRPMNECSRVTETLTFGRKKRVTCNVRQAIGRSNVNQLLFKPTSPEGSFFTLVAEFENTFCQLRRRNDSAPFALGRNAV